ncbi:putative phd-finger domain-containing protein [Phaeoacremonium minimum UCRPA7]|uniref:Chromatin modification-related protein n=1 Tax=Phaeoacremonium minimum (strain UCR-PA7) TaxID=1286976 RepID=R8BMG9_PHAM7|nr:putative phd-finger domain-containing protein [Phaeoacremonium minimum UCRPA7]EOO00561.1 putative phd-finger domain-containing protein [Phaeoacremonium minimum UCRPA7]
MPRDDLSIDFVKRMPPQVEALDPALILDDWINRVQNLPEEIRFIQDEIADKDRQYNDCIKLIEERDARIQKWIKANGSHEGNPREEGYRQTIRENFVKADQLAADKITLTQRLQVIMDKHLRILDAQIKILYDRNEPGFTDPDEVPSLLRPSAANHSAPSIRSINPAANPVTAALSPIVNSASPTAVRPSNPQVRNAQAQQHPSASAPATPAASMILNRQARESSAGPGSGVPKKGPRVNSGLGNAPATSSGLARHSSLGPGTPKHVTATGVPRAGSAGPRATTKGAVTAPGRKAGTPSSMIRKKGTPAATTANKSGLSRVKRAAKNSPSSNADSELSDAESGSGDESDARTGGRGTPAARGSSQNEKEANGGNGGGGGGGAEHHTHKRAQTKREHMDDDEDGMDLDDDDAGDDKKYCLCQNVSFGDMVACDNDDCPYEWFHWSCVGLKSEPNGTWFCPVCTENAKKKK